MPSISFRICVATSVRTLTSKPMMTRRFTWAEDARRVARQFRPQIVLWDVIMPRLVGGDVAEQLRADETLKNAPILFFTAAVSKSRVKQHEGFISGFPFLAKPATVEEIINEIERLVPDEPVSQQIPEPTRAKARL